MTLDSFTDAYIITALWSSINFDTDEPLDRNYTADDLSDELRARMRADCEQFLAVAEPIITAAIDTGEVVCGPDFDEYGRAGHDFWLTRNGHGAGFWDGDWPEPYGQQLTELAGSFGEYAIYPGDDGKLWGLTLR